MPKDIYKFAMQKSLEGKNTTRFSLGIPFNYRKITMRLAIFFKNIQKISDYLDYILPVLY